MQRTRLRDHWPVALIVAFTLAVAAPLFSGAIAEDDAYGYLGLVFLAVAVVNVICAVIVKLRGGHPLDAIFPRRFPPPQD
jgi:hypothetical protein